MTARLRGARLGWRTLAVVLVLVAVGTAEDFPGDRRYHGAGGGPGAFVELHGDYRETVPVGEPRAHALAEFVAKVPVTLLAAGPYATDDGVEVLSVRAGAGHEWSGVAGTRLAPGERVWLVLTYLPTRPGPHLLRGYRVVYRAAGRTHVVTGDDGYLAIDTA